MVTNSETLPTYRQLIPEVLEALRKLGGSASISEINNRVLDQLSLPPEAVALTYPNRSKSILIDRIDWARSYSVLIGMTERPSRGVYLLTKSGEEMLLLSEEARESRIRALDANVRKERRGRKGSIEPTELVIDQEIEAALSVEESWQEVLIGRLHQLSARGFEQFVVFLLREYGLELELVSGPGDNGVDAIGLAPISEVLSSRVAVQVKRYDKASAVSREEVALFQRDSAAKGADRAIFVTLSRFTKPAQNAAIESTPTVNLIDGSRLCQLVLRKGLGITMVPEVESHWFDRFQGS